VTMSTSLDDLKQIQNGLWLVAENCMITKTTATIKKLCKNNLSEKYVLFCW
jgi:hypothetical protein